MDEVPENAAAAFDLPGIGAVFLVRRDNQVYGYLDDCPHIPGARMAWRRGNYLDASGRYIACHGHGALFEIETGLCVCGPCVGQHLSRVPLACDDDRILVMQDWSSLGPG